MEREVTNMIVDPKDFTIPAYYKTLSTRYYNKYKESPSEFISCHEPCHNCICLAMCLNKTALQILHCPIVVNLFHWKGINIPVHTTIVVDIKSFDVLFWIIRTTHINATVEVVIDDVIQFMSIVIRLNDKGMLYE
jgi:hypothetical protein